MIRPFRLAVIAFRGFTVRLIIALRDRAISISLINRVNQELLATSNYLIVPPQSARKAFQRNESV